MSTDGPVAFVTGASRGIGRASAVALARAGFDVVLTARTLREGDGRAVRVAADAPDLGDVVLPGSLETTAKEVEALGRRALPIRMDLLDGGSVEAAVAEALRSWGRIDLLFSNAAYEGPGLMDTVLGLRLEDAETAFRGSFIVTMQLIQLVLPQMLARGRGHIITMGSNAAVKDPPAPADSGGWGVAHAAAKAAVHRIASQVHIEFFGRGVRCFGVDPGYVITDQILATGSEEATVAAGAWANPAEVPAEVVAWLASDREADALSGQLVRAVEVCAERGLLPGWPPAAG